MVKNKWILDNSGILFPIYGEPVVYSNISNGVYQIKMSQMNKKLGLFKISDKFEFNFKIYDTDTSDIEKTILTTWNSKYYTKNLGVIYNGLKGTGKTVAAKILCNKLDLPVIIISNSDYPDLPDFISSINFECVIFIDEAEKLYPSSSPKSEELLRLIDSMYSDSRKLFILTTNSLDLNKNLIDRPGRIRYIKEFGNLSKEVIKEYTLDNLVDSSKLSEVLKVLIRLKINTIDILKSIIDEINIYSELDLGKSYLNIPKINYKFSAVFIPYSPSLVPKLLEILPPNKEARSWYEKQENQNKVSSLVPVEDLSGGIFKTTVEGSDPNISEGSRLSNEFFFDGGKYTISKVISEEKGLYLVREHESDLRRTPGGNFIVLFLDCTIDQGLYIHL